MRISFRQVQIAAIAMLALGIGAQASRVKDIASVQGVQNNQLYGYGLVVGLDGTGDGASTKFTYESVANMLTKQGIKVPDGIKVKNVAAVMVIATLPPFARTGSTIDVVVNSIGDAKSLQGGTLIQTPLQAANGQIYATAQGPLTVGGFSAGGSGGSVAKNHTAVGRVPNGGIIVKETKTDLITNNMLNITLHRNDFTTSSRAANAIDEALGGHYAKAVDGNVVSVSIPEEYTDNLVGLISEVESVEVKADTVAKVTVNERTGTVIIGGQVRISPCAVAHGSLTVSIAPDPVISQPLPLSDGKTVEATKTEVKAEEQQASLVELRTGTSIEELVKALTALKVTPRDLISILQAIQEAGALQGDLEIM